MGCALENEEANTIAIASDYAAAIQSIRNLSNGHLPCLGIERRIKASIISRTHERDIGYLWVRGHIGIRGNEKADSRAEFESILGDISGSTQIATEEGLTTTSRAARKSARTQAGYGQRRPKWNCHALSAYTWTHTERGP